jgi:hypothetical protein
MNKQTDTPPNQEQQWQEIFSRLTATDNLEYAVLMAHVLLCQDLRALLGARLRAATLPRLNFAAIVELALPGASLQNDRETLMFLNRARNTIAHRTDRANFDKHTKDFVSASWAASPPFSWPENEAKKVELLSQAYISWYVRLLSLTAECQPTSV